MGLKLHKDLPLTQTENEVLKLLKEEFLTVKQIAQRRKSSRQAVYKILRNIKKKGENLHRKQGFTKVEPTYNKNDIRLHGQEINIKIIYQDSKYQRLLEKSNIIFPDGNTIRLYKNSIEIYSGQSFYGKTTEEAERKSLEYIKKLILRLENDLKIVLIKARSRNIRVVNQHFARGDSEISEKAYEEGRRIWIYAEEDGKLCYITDDSFGFKEDETLHPKTAKKDREAIDKHINDWRLNDPPTSSETLTLIQALTTNAQANVNNIDKLTKMVMLHEKRWQERI